MYEFHILDAPDGAYGEDEVLLSKDVNLIELSDFADTGFGICPFLTPASRSILQHGCTLLLRRKMAHVGIDTADDFAIADYHKYVDNQEAHERLIRKINIGIHRSEFPIDMDAVERFVSLHCRRDVVCYGDNFFMRIVRPQVPENNPFHRDVWLDHLRNLVNIYIPLSGSGPKSALQVVPGSHLWKESDVMRTGEGAKLNGRAFTVPACLAYRRRAVPVRGSPDADECMIFSPYLIHGNGTNLMPDTTRCSLEIRFQARECCVPNGLLDHADQARQSWPSRLSRLGIGSIWFGAPWPPAQADSWVQPSQAEVDAYLMRAITVASMRKECLFIDTAPGYRNAEAMIGSFIQRHPEHRSSMLLGTKWGEVFDAQSVANRTDFSMKALHASLETSRLALGPIDLLMTHLTSNITPADAIDVLRIATLEAELKCIRWKCVAGVFLIGVSISNAEVLATALGEGLLRSMDVLQVPAWLVRQHPHLVQQFVEQSEPLGPGRVRHVIVNSPVRHRPEHVNPKDALASLALMSSIDVILTGSRSHFEECVVSIFGESITNNTQSRE